LAAGSRLTSYDCHTPRTTVLSPVSGRVLIMRLSTVNVHEHIQSRRQVPQLLRAMDSLGIEKTVLLGSSWFTITLDPKVRIIDSDRLIWTQFSYARL
jgi:hypothetical protein